MIIVRFRGGLGNQLFQYAAGYSLAKFHGVELWADLYTYTKHKFRSFELSNFNINIPEASRDEVHKFTGANIIERYLNKRSNYFYCPGVFSQPHYHFYEDFFSLPVPIYLNGYWQSEKYFTSVASDVRKAVTPVSALDPRNRDLINTVAECESVAVHIRRSDYTQTGFFKTMGMDYYERAFGVIERMTKNPRYFVFSDDIAWSREQLRNLGNVTFVDHNRGKDSYKDLLVMSACKHQVIANSTFSWWAAWLNNNPSRIVIAPETWFHDTYLTKKEPVYPCRIYNTKDLIPQTWIRL